ncbi:MULTISPECIES: hypothetical protein [Clostridium]|uniref:hypothetical protein n=1 Tax=Clostridium TaxID=1485 RepID=UPI0012FD8430|nr:MULTISPECIES: hypothetical protein [Clostridium]
MSGEIIKRFKLCDERNCKVKFTMHDNKINSIISTNTGYLFDAVNAILNIIKICYIN